eukprot:3078234-Prymnesium_polylepis.1
MYYDTWTKRRRQIYVRVYRRLGCSLACSSRGVLTACVTTRAHAARIRLGTSLAVNGLTGRQAAPEH